MRNLLKCNKFRLEIEGSNKVKIFVNDKLLERVKALSIDIDRDDEAFDIIIHEIDDKDFVCIKKVIVGDKV